MLAVPLFHESAQAFILLIFLIGNLTIVDLENPGREYEVLEYYAGTARLARLGKAWIPFMMWQGITGRRTILMI